MGQGGRWGEAKFKEGKEREQRRERDTIPEYRPRSTDQVEKNLVKC